VEPLDTLETPQEGQCDHVNQPDDISQIGGSFSVSADI
jgi:hypothetical protein